MRLDIYQKREQHRGVKKYVFSTDRDHGIYFIRARTRSDRERARAKGGKMLLKRDSHDFVRKGRGF